VPGDVGRVQNRNVGGAGGWVPLNRKGFGRFHVQRVLVRDHFHNAWNCLGAFGVDTEDFAFRDGAIGEGRVEKAIDRIFRRELRLTGHLFLAVDAIDRLPYILMLLTALVVNAIRHHVSDGLHGFSQNTHIVPAFSEVSSPSTSTIVLFASSILNALSRRGT